MRRELKNSDLSRRSEKIVICRGKVENRDLARRMGKLAIPNVPQFPFVLDTDSGKTA